MEISTGVDSFVEILMWAEVKNRERPPPWSDGRHRCVERLL